MCGSGAGLGGRAAGRRSPVAGAPAARLGHQRCSWPRPPPCLHRAGAAAGAPSSLRRQCSAWPCAHTRTHFASASGGSTSMANSRCPRLFSNVISLNVTPAMARRPRAAAAGWAGVCSGARAARALLLGARARLAPQAVELAVCYNFRPIYTILRAMESSGTRSAQQQIASRCRTSPS